MENYRMLGCSTRLSSGNNRKRRDCPCRTILNSLTLYLVLYLSPYVSFIDLACEKPLKTAIREKIEANLEGKYGMEILIRLFGTLRRVHLSIGALKSLNQV